MRPGYTACVRWHGVLTHDTEVQPILDDSSIACAIPKAWDDEKYWQIGIYQLQHSAFGLDGQSLRVTL
ncbi:hypothetical protein [Pseudomonas lini]